MVSGRREKKGRGSQFPIVRIVAFEASISASVGCVALPPPATPPPPPPLLLLLARAAATGEMAEPSEGVPPALPDGVGEQLAELRATGEQQLRDGMFLEAMKTLTMAVDLAEGAEVADEDLEQLHADAMQKAALVRVPRRAGHPTDELSSSSRVLDSVASASGGPGRFRRTTGAGGKGAELSGRRWNRRRRRRRDAAPL